MAKDAYNLLLQKLSFFRKYLYFFYKVINKYNKKEDVAQIGKISAIIDEKLKPYIKKIDIIEESM